MRLKSVLHTFRAADPGLVLLQNHPGIDRALARSHADIALHVADAAEKFLVRSARCDSLPHCAGNVSPAGTARLQAALFAENPGRFCAGKPLKNLEDTARA